MTYDWWVCTVLEFPAIHLHVFICRFREGEYISTPDTSGSLFLNHAKLEHGGQYYCKVTNPQGGSVNSDTVTVTVGEQSLIL